MPSTTKGVQTNSYDKDKAKPNEFFNKKDDLACYLIAKEINKEGCIAVKVERGKALAALVTYLTQRTLEKNIQILTVSDMDMYGEYKPYHLVDSEQEFINQVFLMMDVAKEGQPVFR